MGICRMTVVVGFRILIFSSNKVEEIPSGGGRGAAVVSLSVIDWLVLVLFMNGFLFGEQIWLGIFSLFWEISPKFVVELCGRSEGLS
jgi:hypothetical protein